ncbi:MAG: ATP-dependent Clp protease proteolytic subunit, partial [Elusimicrobia bacterium]|nr:ATP-dependent Clp protease proteolytic subunit [Elusimicrobiota bacterium]
MPTWSEILQELKTETAQKGPVAIDLVRRKYLSQLAAYTGRDTILYATKWTDPIGVSPNTLSITDEDVQAFMEVVYGLKSGNLDLILHSPGGSAEATEAIVTYIRSKFKDIRVIVPQAAMSAATMLACASNIIVLARHSSMGPVDPQMILQTQLGIRVVPAQAILDQFELAKRECQDSKKLGSWLPILSQYGPA